MNTTNRRNNSQPGASILPPCRGPICRVIEFYRHLANVVKGVNSSSTDRFKIRDDYELSVQWQYVCGFCIENADAGEGQEFGRPRGIM